MNKIAAFTSVRIRGHVVKATLNRMIKEDKALSELLHPENDFLYEPKSKEQHLKYIEKLASKK